MEDKRLDREIRSILLEEPKNFAVGGNRYYLYPPTLGKTLLISKLLDEIKDKEGNIVPVQIALLSPDNYKGILCRLLAYHTLETRDELLNFALVSKRAKELEEHLDAKVVAGLVLIAINVIPLEEIHHYIGLDVDKRDMAKINKVKSQTSKNSLSFGGRSLFGSLIGPACEKFHLTPRQVIWEISYRMLQMLLADSITSVYLTDEEFKKCRISDDRTVINMDDKDAAEIIKSMDWS